jgi:diacylglycerol kinase family enzyme
MTETVPFSAAEHLQTCDALIVANPAAGSHSADLVATVAGILASSTRGVTVAWTEAPGHAARLTAQHADAGLVVAIGGDGTVSEVASAMIARPSAQGTLLVVPAGSGNSVARNLWGDLDAAAILELLDTPSACTVRRIDALRLHEPAATVLLGTSTGFLADVLIKARGVDDDLTGIDRYYAAAFEVLQDMPSHPTRVTVDGVVIHDGPASSVAVGGGRYRARSFNFLPYSELDDGLLDVSTIDDLDGPDILELAARLPSGDHLTHPGVGYARGRHAVIERTDGANLVAEFDGDVWDASGPRLTIDIAPSVLNVVGPAHPPCG